MHKYICYLRNLMRHKWFTFVECCTVGVPWLGVIHDWSKFLPSEFIAYARHFEGDYPDWNDLDVWGKYHYTGPTTQRVKQDFDAAWNYHQKRNKHHWQYWVLINDEDGTYCLPMPDKYRREMLADWRGASRAYTGGDNTREWYAQRRDSIQLHPDTRAWIERELGGFASGRDTANCSTEAIE